MASLTEFSCTDSWKMLIYFAFNIHLCSKIQPKTILYLQLNPNSIRICSALTSHFPISCMPICSHECAAVYFVLLTYKLLSFEKIQHSILLSWSKTFIPQIVFIFYKSISLSSLNYLASLAQL